MTERMSKAALSAIGEAVASELGWKVVPCEYEHCVKLANDEGQGVTINSSWAGDGRLSISGNYPRTKDNQCYGHLVKAYNEALPSITVAWSKSPKLIAGDIRRRLLPDYLAMHAKAVARKQAAEQYQSAAEQILARLESLGLRVNRENLTFDAYSHQETRGYLFRGQVSDSTVSLDLRSIPAEKAEAILKIFLDK